MTATDTIEIMASAGHGEYGDLASPLVRVLWEPTTDSLMDEIDGDEETAQHLWRDSYGDLAYPPADLTWEIIIGIRGTRAEVGAWFDRLVTDLFHTPSGDDDMYDYWPSGVRLAREVAAVLGQQEVAILDSAIASTLAGAGIDAEDLGI